MGDKNKEKECFERVLKCNTVVGKFANDVHQVLLKKEAFIDYSSECPDIVYKSGTEIIGIEHCQIDVLFRVKKNKAQSLAGKEHNTAVKQVEKYKDEKLLFNEIENNKALGSVLDVVEERYDCQNKFDYSQFISNFKRVTEEHNSNCEKYRNNLLKESNNKPITLGCLIEIPYPKFKYYIILDSKGERKQAINGIPFTYDMILSIQNMKNFDFIIVLLRLMDYECKAKDICYYFRPLETKEHVIMQSIKLVKSFKLPNALDLPFKADITFPRGKIIKEGDIITINSEIRKKTDAKGSKIYHKGFK